MPLTLKTKGNLVPKDIIEKKIQYKTFATCSTFIYLLLSLCDVLVLPDLI